MYLVNRKVLNLHFTIYNLNVKPDFVQLQREKVAVTCTKLSNDQRGEEILCLRNRHRNQVRNNFDCNSFRLPYNSVYKYVYVRLLFKEHSHKII